jgi:hypothetical protein
MILGPRSRYRIAIRALLGMSKDNAVPGFLKSACRNSFTDNAIGSLISAGVNPRWLAGEMLLKVGGFFPVGFRLSSPL